MVRCMRLAMLFPGILLLGASQSIAQQSQQIGVWELPSLREAPEFRWVQQEGAIHSLLYSGQPLSGEATEIFAFYASPATLQGKRQGSASEYPGVVLIHGGGGTAFAEWVSLWAERGYAAIAMDLSGRRPIEVIYADDGKPVPGQASRRETRTRLDRGGPEQGHPEKFDSIGGTIEDDWPWHAASAGVLAHSLLRSFSDVDANRTAVTGISWGGYTTCLVASLDDRFRAAVPVYGCGFLHEGESVQKPAIDQLGERREAWVKAYDPGSLLPNCRVPILFVNGTHDVHYPLDSYRKSFDAVPAAKQMRIELQMRHSHPAGWAPQEIGLFIDSYCRGGVPLPVIGTPEVTGNLIMATVEAELKITAAAVHFTVEEGLRSKRAWKTIPATVTNGIAMAEGLPEAANTWIMTVTDERGTLSSSVVQFR